MTDNTNDTTWQAVLADECGYIYGGVIEAMEFLDEDAEVRIRVVRGTAVPQDRDGEVRLPGSYKGGDVASEIECYLVDDDESVSAAVRFAQTMRSMHLSTKCPGGRPGRRTEVKP